MDNMLGKLALLPTLSARVVCKAPFSCNRLSMTSLSRDKREKRIASLMEMGVSRPAAKAALRAKDWQTEEVSLRMRVVRRIWPMIYV